MAKKPSVWWVGILAIVATIIAGIIPSILGMLIRNQFPGANGNALAILLGFVIGVPSLGYLLIKLLRLDYG